MAAFSSLPAGKQTTILNAAFSCFGKNGYKKASVADIAAAAGISKASVFQYFGSKKQLFFFAFDFACREILNEMPMGTDDFFECLRIATDTKMRVMARYPGMYDFLSSFVRETDADIADELMPRLSPRLDTSLGSLFGNVNWEKLKPGIDIEMLINAVRWINEGYLREAVGHKDAETMRQELFRHLDLIKNAYYREEYLQ